MVQQPLKKRHNSNIIDEEMYKNASALKTLEDKIIQNQYSDSKKSKVRKYGYA